MSLSTIRDELDAARWSISQAQKELSKFEIYNETGREYVVQAAKRELEIAFQRIHRAQLIHDGKQVNAPR
ncbi:TPA: hypothetical protein NDY72_000322 [Enterobacter cloacae]|uniref:hypothetical protein n=1 Tax=Enterobacter cloacae TaxID=550 RepID=UPI00211CF3CF|nr:hypothetical protein [Enterobacter cloacae]MCQ9484390.1 hypothetical protein [Enterobacter cloacae]MCQ9527442.1 hypothetical protein [Enterobacter cloacae]MCQ9570083.1 hypothetical protein [Enterobacter cloacae]HCD7173189.1 hypothetical protein [Enterobacter cloacae]HDC4657855.1 hypothetical protein [Enterobacter cloacae]